MIKQARKKSIAVLLVLAMVMLLAPSAFASTISDVPDNSLRIGNDIFDLYSNNLANDNLVQDSLAQGNPYFKFDGVWYDVFAAQSDADLGNPSSACAVPQSTVDTWTNLNKWYKAGDVVEDFAPKLKVETVTAINGTITVKMTGEGTPVESDFSFGYKINGVGSKPWPDVPGLGSFDWTEATKTATFTFTKFAPTNEAQSIEICWQYVGNEKGGWADPFSVAANALAVSSVSAITKTSVEVKLAAGADSAKAADKASYVVKVGDSVINVTKVDYNKALNKAVLEVVLDGFDGKLTVNGVESAAFDFKPPAISNVTPINLNQFKVEFNEKLNTASVDSATYVVVEEANVLNSFTVNTKQLGEDNKTVYFTTNAKLTKGTKYIFGVKNIKDSNLNAAKELTGPFTAVEDTDKPVINEVKALDANKIQIVMSKPVTGVTQSSITVKPYGLDGKLGTALTVASAKIESTVGDFGTKINVVLDDETLLENGKNYNLSLIDAKDQSNNTIADKANYDFVGVRDVTAPTVVKSEFKDGKLSITFSEKVKSKNVDAGLVTGSAILYVANTGVNMGNPSKVETKDSVTYSFVFTNLANDTEYSVVLNGIIDFAKVSNALKANTVVAFKTPPAEVKAAEVSSATAQSVVDKKSAQIGVVFTNSVAKAEAETIANYSIVKTDDANVSIAVTKATYNTNTKTVTLITAPLDGANYTVTVSNISNLVAGKNIAKFDSEDVIAPIFKEIKVVNSKVVYLVFNEALTTTPAAIVTVVKDGDVEAVSKSDKLYGNTVILNFADKALTPGSQYIVAVTKATDKAGNEATKQIKTFIAGAADTTPAKLTGVNVISSVQIELKFDEDLGLVPPKVGDTITLTAGDKPVNITAGALTFKSNTVTLKTTTSMFANGDTCVVKVIGGIQDLAGNTTTDSSYTFTGVVDTVGPKLLTAAAGKTDDTIVLTFDKAIDPTSIGVKDAYVVTNVETYQALTVSGAAIDGKNSKVINLTVEGMQAQVTYRVYVKADIANTEVDANKGYIKDQDRLAEFVGIDTTAPTITKVSLNSNITGVIDKENKKISVTIPAPVTVINSGTVTLSEDVYVTLDAKTDKFDIVNPVFIPKSLSGEDIVKLISSIYGKDAVSADTLIANSGSTLTLKDAAGNSTTYTLEAAAE